MLQCSHFDFFWFQILLLSGGIFQEKYSTTYESRYFRENVNSQFKNLYCLTIIEAFSFVLLRPPLTFYNDPSCLPFWYELREQQQIAARPLTFLGRPKSVALYIARRDQIPPMLVRVGARPYWFKHKKTLTVYSEGFRLFN